MSTEEEDFDKAFGEAAAQAERTPEQIEADEKTRREAEAKAAAATAQKTPEQIEAERVAAEAAKAKEAEEAERAAAEAKANEGKTPEQIEAERAAAEAAKKVEDEAKAKREAEEKAQREAEEKASAEAKAKQEAAAEAARKAAEEATKPYEPTEAEKAALAQFAKDFPNEYAAMEARLKSVDKTINARVYEAVQGVLKTVGTRLEAVETTTVQSAQEQHFAALHQAHPDYDAVIPKVADWIKTLPAYAQPGAQAIFDGGTTAEVAQLVTDYKAAVGAADPAAAEAAAKAKAAADAKAKAAAAAAAAADDLSPVSSRRSAAAPTQGKKDPNDYDGAWDELVAATGGGR